MTDAYQNLLYALIIVISLIVCWPLVPKPAATAEGIFLPGTDQVFAAIDPAQVSILENPAALPANAKPIGLIRTQIYIDKTHNGIDATKAKLTALAAANGAKLVLLTGYGNELNEGPLDSMTLLAEGFNVR